MWTSWLSKGAGFGFVLKLNYRVLNTEGQVYTTINRLLSKPSLQDNVHAQSFHISQLCCC